MKQPTAPGPGQGVRALRELANLTLDEVADEAAVSASYLSKVENGTKGASPVWLGRVSAIIARHLVGATQETRDDAA